MKRLKEKELQQWIDNGNEALLVDGARQVGKTYLIREMLEKNKIPYFEINFVLDKEMLEIFKNTQSNQDLLYRLKLYSNDAKVIFLDEIQEYPEIVLRIKWLVDEGSFRYVLSGSLLGVTLKGLRSFPVGYVKMIRLYPMSFFEFALALGVQEKTLAYIEDCFEKRIEVDEIIHHKLINLFKTYLMVGGMPQVVNEFSSKHDLELAKDKQISIINQYKADFIKYETVEKKLKIISIYDNVPAQLNKHGLRFKFTYLNKELKFDRYENSFLWLAEAGVVLPTYDVDEPYSPLSSSKEKNLFKLFMSDVGLLSSNYPNSLARSFIAETDNQDYNLGGLHENFIAQELNSNGFPLYYFNDRNIGELDFLLETKNGIFPIEVKSGQSITSHKSLDHFLSSQYRENITEGYVFSYSNLKIDGKVTYLPFYMASLVGKEKERLGVIDLDISGI